MTFPDGTLTPKGVSRFLSFNLILAKNLSNSGIEAALQFVVNHHLGNVVSMSFGGDEKLNAGFAQVGNQLFKQLAAEHITVLAASGDTGLIELKSNTAFERVASYPASDPLVTAVGGITLFVDAKAHYVAE
jgi:subtilase family serine protease